MRSGGFGRSLARRRGQLQRTIAYERGKRGKQWASDKVGRGGRLGSAVSSGREGSAFAGWGGQEGIGMGWYGTQ